VRAESTCCMLRLADVKPSTTSRHGVLAIVLLAVALVVLAVVEAGSHRTSVGIGSMRIAKLRAGVVEMGTLSSWDYHDTAYGVRVRATVCFDGSLGEEVYPVEFRIAHFALSESKPRSWGKPFRTVADDAHWLVPFGETATRKDGRSCSEVVLEDILPDEDTGVSSRSSGCYQHTCQDLRTTATAFR